MPTMFAPEKPPQPMEASQITLGGGRPLSAQPGTALAQPPIFELASLLDRHQPSRRKAAENLLNLAATNGFFYLTEHGVDLDLIDSVYVHAAAYFARDEEDKLRDYIGSGHNHRGYVPTSERGLYADEIGPRNYEAFDMGVGRELTPADRDNPLLGPNRWPDQAGFEQVMSRYLRNMLRLTKVLTLGIELALEVPYGTFTRHMTNPVSQLRLLHYLPNDQHRRAPVNMGAHTDYELFTVLHSRNPGLQVLDPDLRWISAPPIEGAFYFNAGDMFEAWTGGLVVATAHRVENRGTERFSVPFFAATDYNTVVAPVASPRFSARQRHYSPIRAGQHLLTQLLRDFPYLQYRHNSGQLPIINDVESFSCDQNPFESRIHRQRST